MWNLEKDLKKRFDNGRKATIGACQRGEESLNIGLNLTKQTKEHGS